MNLEGHVKMEELLMGYSLPEIDRLMDDLEAIKIYGPGHRIVNHNMAYLFFIEQNFGKDAYRIALLHILVDYHIIDWNLLGYYFEVF